MEDRYATHSSWSEDVLTACRANKRATGTISCGRKSMGKCTSRLARMNADYHL